MKTLQELYTEIIGSEKLKKAFAEAAKGGKLAEFLKAHGCEVTAEEIKAFLKEKADQSLSEEELDSVAGGTCNEETGYETAMSVLSLGIVCATIAIDSAVTDDSVAYVGQRKDTDGRLCNVADP